jgi:hypothetical protein
VSDLLTRREVARRLHRPVDYVSGAIDALRLPVRRHGKAYVITETQFRRLEHLRREPAATATT